MDSDAARKDPAIASALGLVRMAVERLESGPAPRRLLVACSGGADSVVALGLLWALRSSLDLQLAVGHVDHGLRVESASEAAMVAALAEQFGLEFRSTRVGLALGPGLPNRAREARRHALIEQARELGSTTIVLAHTATDQAETMLMHLTRGAGLDGLAAMPVHEPPWLRPMLQLTRPQIRELAGRLGLKFVDDPSNSDPNQFRVWLRTQVLPGLRERNPEVERALGGLARQARDADEALSQWAASEIERRRDLTEARHWSLDDFDRLPRAVRTRVLRRIAELEGIDLEQLRRRTLDQLDAAAVAVARGGASSSPKGWDLAPKLRLTIDRRGIRVAGNH